MAQKSSVDRRDFLKSAAVNYGNNTAPEFITCCHEESAVAFAHGYAKVEGKTTEKTVKDSELADIYTFLRSQPGPPDVDKIPQLK